MSRPVRARGLKRRCSRQQAGRRHVAPRAGAWIETSCRYCYQTLLVLVAPRAGAWIETYPNMRARLNMESRPVRARGLKRVVAADITGDPAGRAPCGRVD